MLGFCQWFNQLISADSCPSPVDTYLNAEATVADSIPPQGKGKVRIFGSYWPAVAETVTKIEISVGTRVIVQRREGIALVVRPLPTEARQLADVIPLPTVERQKTEDGRQKMTGT